MSLPDHIWTLAFGLMVGMTSAAQATEWMTDHEAALKKARSENKLMLMNFTGSDWCPWCVRLDREIFSTREFKDYADKNLVLLTVDFPRRKQIPDAERQQNERLAKEYGVEGFPTLVLVKGDGTKIGELGYMEGGPKPFLAQLEKIRRK